MEAERFRGGNILHLEQRLDKDVALSGSGESLTARSRAALKLILSPLPATSPALVCVFPLSFSFASGLPSPGADCQSSLAPRPSPPAPREIASTCVSSASPFQR